jgi:membrane fusion protein, multidrug efflux system
LESSTATVPKFLLAGLLLLAGPSADTAATGGKTYSSHLMVDQEVAVTARLTGIVQTIHVDRGSAVGKGQPLASLDPTEFDLDLRESREEMELRRAEYDRAKALSTGKIVSAAELDEKKARYEVTRAKYDKAREIRSRAVVRAPFAGIVSEKYARIGQKVIYDENTPLFKVTALEPLLARVYLPEEELMRVRVGDPVAVVPVKFPDAKTRGRVQFVGPTVDAASGTFQVIVRVLREPGRPALRPGVAVRLQFLASSRS